MTDRPAHPRTIEQQEQQTHGTEIAQQPSERCSRPAAKNIRTHWNVVTRSRGGFPLRALENFLGSEVRKFLTGSVIGWKRW